MFIVKVDIGSKQKYIFSSNRLKEIIGASEIIRYVTEKLGKEVLKSMNKEFEYYEDDNSGNVLFEAGGNAMYIFKDIEEAKEFNKIFSRFVIKYFDGLELLMVIKEFDMQKDTIVNLYEEIEQILTKKKGKRKYQFRRVGYGLTKVCPNTRKPAGYEYEELNNKGKEEYKYISKESKDKLRFYNFLYGNSQYYDEENEIKYMIGSNKINNKEIEECDRDYKLKDGFEFTTELDIISGPKDEGSYIAIICIDGNGMGKKFDSFNYKYKDVSKEKIFASNHEYIKEFRSVTKKVDNNYKKVFNQTVEILIDNYNNYYKKIGYEKDGKVLPIRPIILAGDDITFISNGKIAIDITKIFTEEITKQKEIFGDNEYNLTTSAGIAIVKRNYPFSRAVKLAGALEKNSKKKLRTMKLAAKKIGLKSLKEGSFVDWEINRGDTLDDISFIRDKDVVARPYMIVPKEDKQFKNIIDIYNNNKNQDLKRLINYNFDNFDKVLRSINKSEAKSNMKSFFRTMNSKEVDSELFYLKYNLRKRIKGEIDSKILKKVVYDAIDAMDLYTYVKGEE